MKSEYTSKGIVYYCMNEKSVAKYYQLCATFLKKEFIEKTFDLEA